MKKLIKYISIVVLVAITGCDDEVLDQQNLYNKSLDNFYSTPTDIEESISGVYNALYVPGVHGMESVAANLMSDMMLGGGGPDDKSAKYVDGFEDPLEDTYRDMWVQNYNGITRANAIIEKTPEIDFSTYFDTEEEANAFKAQAIGESYFMRAFFYFRGAKFFGGLPLIINVDDDRTVARSTITETFAQIASDLKAAIEILPSTSFAGIPTSDYGHTNKWVAEAYLARVYLYYTGYMTNIEGQATSDLPLADGGSLSSSDVVGYLNDCMANSGHQLASDFRNLWPYSYANTSAGSVVLPWADTEGLNWVGQDGHSPTYGSGNYETMFAIRYSATQWEWGHHYTNRLPLFFGIRGNSTMQPYGEGWGWGTVNPNLWNEWDDADPRKVGSIITVGDAEQGTDGYSPDKGDHETGYFNKKYTNLQHDGANGRLGMFYYLYNLVNGDKQLWHAQDFYLMRYADVLLMHSEISGTADGMNAVRARAGLPAIGYSLDALKEERLHEFSFEGIRWFDIVRWGDVNTAFDGTINVRNSGVDASYSVNYRPETKGLVPVPETEIRLSNGVYEQNPGW